MQGNHNGIEKRLWIAADELRANYKLKGSEWQDMATSSNYFFYFNLLQGREQVKSRSSGAAITAVTGIFIIRGNFCSDGVQAFNVIRHKVRKLVESGEFHYPVLKLIPEIMNAKSQ